MLKSLMQLEPSDLREEAIGTLEGGAVGVALGALARTLGGLDIGPIPVDLAFGVVAAAAGYSDPSSAVAYVSGDCAAIYAYRKMVKP